MIGPMALPWDILSFHGISMAVGSMKTYGNDMESPWHCDGTAVKAHESS